MRPPLLRPVLALLLFTAWLALLFAGLAAGGAVHLLLVGAAAVFPWRALGGAGQSLIRAKTLACHPERSEGSGRGSAPEGPH